MKSSQRQHESIKYSHGNLKHGKYEPYTYMIKLSDLSLVFPRRRRKHKHKQKYKGKSHVITFNPLKTNVLYIGQ